MKKIRKAIYSLNEWYDDLEEPKRFLYFLLIIGGSNVLTQILVYCYDMWYAFPIWVIVMFILRGFYVFKPKKTYLFDVETDGLGYDHLMAIKFIEKQKKTKKDEKSLE